MIILIGILFFIMIVLAYYCTILITVFFEAPFIPTGQKEIARIFDAIALTPGQVLYELGSGDGRVVRAAASHGARAIGIERSFPLIVWSRVIGWLLKRREKGQQDGAARFIHGSFYTADLRDADVVFCYLFPETMARLKEKFTNELKPGTRIISRAFKIAGWTPVKRLQFHRRSPPIYLYIK